MDLEATLQWYDLTVQLAPAGIEPATILAIIWIESRGDSKVFNARSQATGLMQIMPQEAGAIFADRPTIEELKDAQVNILWGIEVLEYSLHRGGSLYEALYRYSGGAAWKSRQDFAQKYWQPFLKARRQIRAELRKREPNGRL